jgi:serine/threonine protein kinase
LQLLLLAGYICLMTESNEFGNFGQSAPANDPPQKDNQFASGQVLIGKYEVLSLIGVGGMGKVYKVRQVFLNKALALKVLDLHQAMSELQMRRFQLEAKAAFSLSHPNLVKVFDFGLLESDDPYLVMDFVDGITLHDHLKREGPLTSEQCVKVFIQAASGLAYAHQRSVVHRDIKPSNIMLDAGSKIGANNSVKIVDFGIAKLSESGELQGLTRTGEIFGSPLYMSPEQCSGEVVDHRSDIYSLGCTLFEALTGTPPHVGNSALRTMMLHKTSPAPYLREASLGVTYPENLEQIVHRMLEKSPADRYQSLDDVVDDLNKALGQVAIATRPVSSKALSVSKDARTISMKPFNFTLMIVSVIVVTSVVTLSTERFVRARLHKQKVHLNAPAAKVNPVDRFAHESQEHESSEFKKGVAIATSDASKAFEKSGPIKPRFFQSEGIDWEQVTFPDSCIGIVSNESFCRPRTPGDLSPVLIKLAKSTLTFQPQKILQLQLGAKDPEGLKNSSILQKIDPTLFQELVVFPAYSDLYEDKGEEKQTEQVVKVLETVSAWTKLDGISIREMACTKPIIKALNKLKKLEYLQLWECQTDIDTLVKEPYLQRLKYLSLTKIPCEQIIDSICTSSALESLSLSETDIPAFSLDKLRMLPNLTFLDMRVQVLGPRQMEAISKLKKLARLQIRDSNLTPKQLKFLLANCPSLKILALNGGAAEHVKAKLVEDPRIELFE